MQRSTQLTKAVLELKLMCDVLMINLATPFVPHSGHMHLPDQKAHVRMRLQEMFEEKQFGNRCM